MTKRNVIMLVLSVLLMAYLVVGICYASAERSTDTLHKLKINIREGEGGRIEFVTAADIDAQIDHLSSRISTIKYPELNTLEIEKKILSMDNIEYANCVVLNNGDLRIDVEPLVPVARVFDIEHGNSFYINRHGKRMQANAQFRVDVPVLTGFFSDKHQPTDALPVISHINSHPQLKHYVSAVKMARNGDIVLIPVIRGHVINFGDTADIANKIDRLMVFYRKVMPVKGWEFYDTISVKWRGQVVAKKHKHVEKRDTMLLDEEEYIDDLGTMGIDPNDT